MELLYNWQVNLSRKAGKQAARYKKEQPKVYAELAALMKDIAINGPVRKNWPNFSALGNGKGIPDNAYHCHIKKGRPTYVVCWREEDRKIKIVEVYYVGTHENAPY